MRALALLLAVSIAVPAWPARGDSPTSATEAERTKIYEEGKKLSDQGEWALAAEKFRAVIKIRSAPKALLALAYCEEQQGHLVAAKATYGTALSASHAQKIPADAARAKTAIDQLEPRIARLTVRVVGEVPGASVKIDDADATAGEPLELDPGVHAIRVIASGRKTFSTTVTLKEGAREVVSAPLEPEGAAAPSKDGGAPIETSSGARSAGWVLTIVGGSLVLVGGATALIADSGYRARRGELSELCDGTKGFRLSDDGDACLYAGGTADTGEVQSKNSEIGIAKGVRLGGMIGAGVGAAALIVGVVTLFTSPSSAAKTSTAVPTVHVARHGIELGLSLPF